MVAYANPPARRIPWDRDGSALVFVSAASVITVRTASDRQWMNDETNTSQAGASINATVMDGVVFSVPQTIYGAYWCATNTATGVSWVMEYSLDTTTLVDGTWSSYRAAGSWGNNQDVPTTYRTIVSSGTATGVWVPGGSIAGVKGMRVRCITTTGSPQPTALHFYGQPTSPSNRLMLWHPTIDQGLSATPAIYDLGDIPRGAGPQLFPFRVKNISGSLTAQTVNLMREALTPGSPDITTLMRLRYNGGAWGTTAAIGNLAPGAISAVAECELDVTSLAPVGPTAPRVVAYAASWV